MAIFIPHIKGCDGDSKVYNWLDFTNTKDQNPKILTAAINDKTVGVDHGFIITSNLAKQSIEQPIKISIINSLSELNWSNDASIQVDNKQNLSLQDTGHDLKTHFSGMILSTDQGGFEIETQGGSGTFTADKLSFDANTYTFNAKGYVVIGDEKTNNKGIGSLYIQNSCNALFFNATSDIRAKTNLQHASFNALNIVRSLPVYTFNYKTDSSPAIGLIAQDAEKISFGTDFSLVNNITASGENGDYMSIKESKLVYILWKAIQEQQEQINKLTSLVKDLSRK